MGTDRACIPSSPSSGLKAMHGCLSFETSQMEMVRCAAPYLAPQVRGHPEVTSDWVGRASWPPSVRSTMHGNYEKCVCVCVRVTVRCVCGDSACGVRFSVRCCLAGLRPAWRVRGAIGGLRMLRTSLNYNQNKGRKNEPKEPQPPRPAHSWTSPPCRIKHGVRK